MSMWIECNESVINEHKTRALECYFISKRQQNTLPASNDVPLLSNKNQYLQLEGEY